MTGTLSTLNNLTSMEVDRATRLAAAASLHMPRTRDEMILNGRKVKNLQYCHVLVKTTAQALAGEIYDSAMRINDNYDVWKKLCPDMDSKAMEAEWINLMWPRMLDDARATLARLLGSTLDEALKSQIYEAIIKDGALRRKGRGPKPLFRSGMRG